MGRILGRVGLGGHGLKRNEAAPRSRCGAQALKSRARRRSSSVASKQTEHTSGYLFWEQKGVGKKPGV